MCYLFLPIKKSAIVPGPEWEPITLPIFVMTWTFALYFSSICFFSSSASFWQSACEIYAILFTASSFNSSNLSARAIIDFFLPLIFLRASLWFLKYCLLFFHRNNYSFVSMSSFVNVKSSNLLLHPSVLHQALSWLTHSVCLQRGQLSVPLFKNSILTLSSFVKMDCRANTEE